MQYAQQIDAVAPAACPQGQSFEKFFAGFCRRSRVIDFEGLIFGSLADCFVGRSKENGSSSTGFEIA
ncbi:hypothetical protein ORS3428_22130 [Mesorhizobium sp. ORS 3428]|nr:hypothetical protein ORS3428_22130 [Mesorhizobium sp. ORS 3428]